MTTVSLRRMKQVDLLQQQMNQRILILDGAMGTMIQSYGLEETDYRGDRFADWPSELKGNNDLLSLTQPQIIREIHTAYLEAGSDIVETNTFNSNSASMADYGMESLVYELNKTGAALAREACNAAATDTKPRFAAGVLGPTSRTWSLSPDVNDPGLRQTTLRACPFTPPPPPASRASFVLACGVGVCFNQFIKGDIAKARVVYIG